MNERSIAIYARSAVHNPEAIENQVQDCLAYASRLWPEQEIRVFSDQQSSGHDRPAYAHLMDAIEHQEIGAVVVRDQARIARQPEAWFGFVDTCIFNGTAFHTLRWGEVDLIGEARLRDLLVMLGKAERQAKRRQR
jgi:DNA invertase Pin-like site-specific DNA recombinase